MTGRDALRSQLLSAAQQGAELHKLIAANAGVGRAPRPVLIGVVADHGVVEDVLEVEHVVPDAEARRDPPCVLSRAQPAAAALVSAVQSRRVPDQHGHADHLEPLLQQQRCRDRAVHAAAHPHDNSFLDHGCPTRLRLRK